MAFIAATPIIREAFRFTSARRPYHATLAGVLSKRCDLEIINREDREVRYVFDARGRHAIVILENAPIETL